MLVMHAIFAHKGSTIEVNVDSSSAVLARTMTLSKLGGFYLLRIVTRTLLSKETSSPNAFQCRLTKETKSECRRIFLFSFDEKSSTALVLLMVRYHQSTYQYVPRYLSIPLTSHVAAAFPYICIASIPLRCCSFVSKSLAQQHV
jgi:hypothetical protein